MTEKEKHEMLENCDNEAEKIIVRSISVKMKLTELIEEIEQIKRDAALLEM